MIKSIFYTACAAIAMTILVGNAAEAAEYHTFNGVITEAIEPLVIEKAQGDSYRIASGNHSAEITRDGDWRYVQTKDPVLGISLVSNGDDVQIKMSGITVYNSSKSKTLAFGQR